MFNKAFIVITNFVREEEAATAVEYAVMLALIIAVCIGSIGILANNVGDSIDESSNAIDAAISN